ncbi:hypothetical protein TcWFU_002712 [Taenia crassiceps]|uniref:39S ribosomal protein L52, mitochondrial n=1 Tax=Taenia crassiceps TaxID=6207 RepID=A0ABR4PZU7_9CEST
MCLFWGAMRAAVLSSPFKTTERFAGGVFRARYILQCVIYPKIVVVFLQQTMNGRTPRITTVGQRRRLAEQYAVTKQIVTLSSELNESNRKLKEQQDADARCRAEIKGRLLKEKGLKKLA